MKTFGVGYTYQPSTLEEGLDGIKPFDMQHGDQILLESSYQHENVLLTNFSSKSREFRYLINIFMAIFYLLMRKYRFNTIVD